MHINYNRIYEKKKNSKIKIGGNTLKDKKAKIEKESKDIVKTKEKKSSNEVIKIIGVKR